MILGGQGLDKFCFQNVCCTLLFCGVGGPSQRGIGKRENVFRETVCNKALLVVKGMNLYFVDSRLDSGIST